METKKAALERKLNERLDLLEANTEAVLKLEELLAYLATSKFASPGNDFVHISTDLAPKLREIKLALAHR